MPVYYRRRQLDMEIKYNNIFVIKYSMHYNNIELGQSLVPCVNLNIYCNYTYFFSIPK